MRFWIVCFGILATLLGPLAAFPSPQDDSSAVRLLNAEEGSSLVNIAWEQREQVRTKPDCSHLVHEVYELSGFPYPYASSYDLYDGIDNFQRVTTPRAGDLIVWRGHVGIVFDPAEHSFYSSVRSGLRTENYDAPYWKAQGRPRFYRYVVRGPVTLTAESVSPPVTSSRSQIKSAVVPVRREVSAAAPVAAAPIGSTSPSDRPSALPSQIMIVAAANRPTSEEVGEAVSEFASAAGSSLRGWPSANSTRPVLVYDRLIVEGLDLKGDRGWARVKIVERLSIDGQRLEAKKGQEELRWEVRRTPQGWQLLAPSKRTYVPRDVAVHSLATQLAALTQNEPADADRSLHQETLIIRALGSLVDAN